MLADAHMHVVFYLRSCSISEVVNTLTADLKSSALNKYDRELGHSPESRHAFSSLFISLLKGGSLRASLSI